MVRIISVLSFFAVASSARAGDSACSSGAACPSKGSAMLQVHHQNVTLHRVSPEEAKTKACKLGRAMDAPLTEDGFKTISDTCCYEDMKAFIRRVVDDMGMKVCDEGGLSGIAPFYSCPANIATFSELMDELNKAVQTGDSKCHWLANRIEDCRDSALECAVSSQKPPPAPKPVATGFVVFLVTNPAEMIRSSKAIDVVQNDVALSLGVDTSYVNIVIASGPLDGEEVVSSFFGIPPSQSLYSVADGVKQCKVFAVYSIQESAPPADSITTPPPQLNEQDIVNRLKQLDVDTLGTRLTQDLDTVDKQIGSLEVLETSVCEKTTGKCTHEVIREI